MHVRTIICVNIFVEQSILLAKSAIELLSEIVEWAVTKTLEEYVDALIDVVCAYLQVYLRIIHFISITMLFSFTFFCRLLNLESMKRRLVVSRRLPHENAYVLPRHPSVFDIYLPFSAIYLILYSVFISYTTPF